MPKETDKATLDLLARLLQDTASNVVIFSKAAMSCGHRRDEGYPALLPADWPDELKRARLKDAMVEDIRLGRGPNRALERGEGLETTVYHEFRIEVAGMGLYVKTVLGGSADDPELKIISVKRRDE